MYHKCKDSEYSGILSKLHQRSFLTKSNLRNTSNAVAPYNFIHLIFDMKN